MEQYEGRGVVRRNRGGERRQGRRVVYLLLWFKWSGKLQQSVWASYYLLCGTHNAEVALGFNGAFLVYNQNKPAACRLSAFGAVSTPPS